jgi:hypothetical protein
MKRTIIWCSCVLAALITLMQPTAAPAAGAIAVGRCGHNGWATGYGSMHAARANALAQCSANGDACSIIVTVRGSCGALAVAGDCRARGWAYAGTRGAAEDLALGECARRGGNGCSVVRWVCDGGR